MLLKMPKRPLVLLGALLALVTLLTACSGGVAQKDYDAVQAQLKAKEQELAQAKQQPSSAAPSQIVQTGQLQPAPAGAQPTGWETTESAKGGVTLFARYDSSGPDAWDVKAHPLVYVSSEGMNKPLSPGKNTLAGLYVIDGYSKQVVASARYDLALKHTGAGHSVGISPDGKWFLVGSTVEIDGKGTSMVLIINARTLKLEKVLKGASLHHSIGFTDWQGRDRVTVTTNSGPDYILDPKDDHKVVKTFTVANVPMMGHNYVTLDPTGKFYYRAMRPGSYGDAGENGATGGVAKINLETGEATMIWGLGHDGNPIGMAHTADGKFTYVNDAHGDAVYKIDNKTNKVVGKTNAGVAGPYGLALNWDETLLYTVGKGEGSHNTGHVIGVIETKTFAPSRSFNQPIVLGGSASSIDHAILHPDPKVNELWVSNMNGWETIVLDLNTREVKAYIPTPNGGDTHSGGFVRYNPDWTGQLLVDMGGPKKDMYATKLPLAVAAGASTTPQAAASAPAPGTTPSTGGDLLALGKDVFEKKAGGCQACHGMDAKGKIGPNIRASTAVGIRKALTSVTGMIQFAKNLDDRDVEAVAAYLKYLAAQP